MKTKLNISFAAALLAALSMTTGLSAAGSPDGQRNVAPRHAADDRQDRRDDRKHDRRDDRRDDRKHNRRDNRRDHSAAWKENRWDDVRQSHWKNRTLRRLTSLPGGHSVVRHGTRDYHVNGGEYYVKDHNGYVQVDPPVGFVVGNLPAGHQTLNVNGVSHYYSGGVYYRSHARGYEVVRPH